jgi:tRNA-Thr(GGU) m(6)t(6)A37 methyltransferase TsaA
MMNDQRRKMELQPIGVIHTPFTAVRGTPIQPAAGDGAEGWIELAEEYVPALRDLAGFARIWLLYWFDRAGHTRLEVVPFLDDVSHGLFATRAPCRPNPLGLSNVRLLAVEGRILRIAEVDILEGTPLLDIKPFVPRFDNYEVERCGWLDQAGDNRRLADDRFNE